MDVWTSILFIVALIVLVLYLVHGESDNVNNDGGDD